MRKVLVVDWLSDSQHLGDSLRDYRLDHAFNESDFIEKIEINNYQMVLLNIDLFGIDRFSAFRQIHVSMRNSKIPIICLSENADSLTKVNAFEIGAADFITKPIDPLELKARIETRLKIGNAVDEVQDSLVHYKSVTVDLARHEIQCLYDGILTNFKLTPTEFRLFYYFFMKHDQLVSREILFKEVWNSKSASSQRVVDKHVTLLKKKISGKTFVFESIHGRGYRMVINFQQ